MERLYLKSALANSFERVEVEAFSPGSIVVDYYLVFKELPSGRKVTTQDLKDIVDVETKQTDSKNMLGNLRIDPTFSDFRIEAPDAEVWNAECQAEEAKNIDEVTEI